MHELAVTKSILRLALDHSARHGGGEIVSISLAIGEMRNLEQEWLQRYFAYISKGTPAERAMIKVRKIPVVFVCKQCRQSFTADIHADHPLLCAHCGSDEYDLLSGRELAVEQLEVR
jgi:hydrogenase nickel incorporation protein HypA/HybF